MHLTRSPAQWCASFLLLVAAGTHVPLIRDHLAEAPYVGWLFIALSVVCVGLAVAMVLVDSPGVWIVSGAVCLAALVAYLASRTIGLPGDRRRRGQLDRAARDPRRGVGGADGAARLRAPTPAWLDLSE